jgi:hypothetical protein
MAKKGKKAKPDKGAPEGERVAVLAHPRARRSIRRLRARAGLLGLVVVTWLSLRAGLPPFDAVLRGLAGGVAAHFVVWAAGIVAWRHLVLAEIKAHREAREAALRERRADAERLATAKLSA